MRASLRIRLWHLCIRPAAPKVRNEVPTGFLRYTCQVHSSDLDFRNG
jgi:hypothetical protein